MISERIKKYIPSKTYVEYLESINHSFSDFEEAGILYHSIDDKFLMHEELTKLAYETDNQTLKEQIKRKYEQFTPMPRSPCSSLVKMGMYLTTI